MNIIFGETKYKFILFKFNRIPYGRIVRKWPPFEHSNVAKQEPCAATRVYQRNESWLIQILNAAISR